MVIWLQSSLRKGPFSSAGPQQLQGPTPRLAPDRTHDPKGSSQCCIALDKTIALGLGMQTNLNQRDSIPRCLLAMGKSNSGVTEVFRWKLLASCYILRWGVSRRKQKGRIRPNSDDTLQTLTSSLAKAETSRPFAEMEPNFLFVFLLFIYLFIYFKRGSLLFIHLFICCFLGLHPRHGEVPRLGV